MKPGNTRFPERFIPFPLLQELPGLTAPRVAEIPASHVDSGGPQTTIIISGPISGRSNEIPVSRLQ